MCRCAHRRPTGSHWRRISTSRPGSRTRPATEAGSTSPCCTAGATAWSTARATWAGPHRSQGPAAPMKAGAGMGAGIRGLSRRTMPCRVRLRQRGRLRVHPCSQPRRHKAPRSLRPSSSPLGAAKCRFKGRRNCGKKDVPSNGQSRLATGPDRAGASAGNALTAMTATIVQNVANGVQAQLRLKVAGGPQARSLARRVRPARMSWPPARRQTRCPSLHLLWHPRPRNAPHPRPRLHPHPHPGPYQP